MEAASLFEAFAMMEAAWSKENKLHLIDRLLKQKDATLFGVIQRVAESPDGIERMRALFSVGQRTFAWTEWEAKCQARPRCDGWTGWQSLIWHGFRKFVAVRWQVLR